VYDLVVVDEQDCDGLILDSSEVVGSRLEGLSIAQKDHMVRGRVCEKFSV
jgi:hypothetical protein